MNKENETRQRQVDEDFLLFLDPPQKEDEQDRREREARRFWAEMMEGEHE